MKKAKPLAFLNNIPTAHLLQMAKKLLNLTPRKKWAIHPGLENRIIEDLDNRSIKTRRGWRTIQSASHIASLRLYVQPGRDGAAMRVFMPEKMKIHEVPSGFSFALERISGTTRFLAVLLRKSDGMDYHPTDGEIITGNFASMIRNLESNHEARMAEREGEDRRRREYEFFISDAKTTRVTLFDSRRAGNCIEGALAFAESRLGIGRSEILNGGHLFSVSAERLLATNNERARAAAFVAWKRETTISI